MSWLSVLFAYALRGYGLDSGISPMTKGYSEGYKETKYQLSSPAVSTQLYYNLLLQPILDVYHCNQYIEYY